MEKPKGHKLDPLEVTKDFVSRSAQRASVYICYAPGDEAEAKSFASKFESRGTPCWYSARDIKSSTAWPQSVVEAIESSKFFVLIMTARALRTRDIVPEITKARSAGRTIVVLQSVDGLLNPELDDLLTAAHTLRVSDPITSADIDAAWKKLVEVESNSTWDDTDGTGEDAVGAHQAGSFLIDIECTRGKLSGKTSCQLGEGERLVFGRGSEADVFVDDNRASRRHAGLVVERDPKYGLELHMMDLMSRNGTWVRYRREGDADISKFLEHSQVRIVSGAIIRIGSTDFRVIAVRVPAQVARLKS